jgi:hypothetical protein
MTLPGESAVQAISQASAPATDSVFIFNTAMEVLAVFAALAVVAGLLAAFPTHL